MLIIVLSHKDLDFLGSRVEGSSPILILKEEVFLGLILLFFSLELHPIRKRNIAIVAVVKKFIQ